MRLLALALLLSACETLALMPPEQADLAGDIAGPNTVPGEGTGQRPGAGKLEPGFYQRGCQWDACTPPPEKNGGALADPVR